MNFLSQLAPISFLSLHIAGLIRFPLLSQKKAKKQKKEKKGESNWMHKNKLNNI
jgi:hypothetical protein